MRKRTVTAGLLVCAAVAACNLGPAAGDASTSEAANTAARQPLLAPTWTTCWVVKDTTTTDLERQQHAVTCRYDIPDERQPIKPQWMLVEVRARGSNFVSHLEGHPGEDVLVGKVNGNGFPLALNVYTTGDFQKVGIGNLEPLRLAANVDAVDTFTPERPLEIKQPFDVWPVVVIRKSFLFYVQLAERSVSLAPFIVGVEGNTSDVSARGKILGTSNDAEVTTAYFAAPKQGALEGTYKVATATGGSITEIAGGARIPEPGVYVATETEFRRATDEEASAVGPATPSPTDEDAAAPPELDASASTDGGVDASDASAPEPDCGVSGKKCCGGSSGFGGTCGTGSYCPANQNVCVACGGPGETCCGGFGGTCNAGSYCPTNQNRCEPCGEPGQKCCGGFGGTCGGGSYCPANQNLCEACGKVGQRCCGGYGGTCEAGGRCPGNQNICVAN